MDDAEKLFGSRKELLMELEQLSEMQHSGEISYDEYCEEFQKRNSLYQKLHQESEELGHFDTHPQ